MLNLPLSWIPRNHETCKYNQTKPEFIFFFLSRSRIQASYADNILFLSIIAAIETNVVIWWFYFYSINQSISSSSLYLTISFTAFALIQIRKWVIFIFLFSVARHSQTQCSEQVHGFFPPIALVRHGQHLIKGFLVNQVLI